MGWFWGKDKDAETEKRDNERKKLLHDLEALSKKLGVNISDQGKRDENLELLRKEGSGQ